MDFSDQIKERLEDLDTMQLCRFSWLCGLRALPFLSIIRDFDYWPENEKQKHLYSIFYALDVCLQASFVNYFSAPAAANAAAAASAARAAASATRGNAAAFAAYIGSDVNDACTNALVYADSVDSIAKVANAACSAANSARSAYKDDYPVYKDYFSESYDVYAVSHAAYESTYAAAYYAAIYARGVAPNLEKFLLKDIKAINKNRLNECNHDTSIYGSLWDNFQEDLKAIGCTYWARFYENLFNNGFEIDKKQLERRLGVPDEIKAEGAAAVGRYLEGLGDEIERLNEARIIILGERGAGKTSLARKLRDINAKMPKGKDSTEGVDRHPWNFPDKDGVGNVTAHIWDFAGHSITHSAHRFFMSARCLYIYVYNGRIERDNDPAYWLEQIRIHGGDSPVLFLINKKDDHKVDIAEKTLKYEYPSIDNYYYVDIGDKHNTTKLEEFRQKVMDMVRNNPSWNSQVVSAEAYKIKNELREHFEKTKVPHITRDQFDKIAKNCGIQDERIKEILKDLHTLGICLWYNKEDMEDYNTLVLNPDWIIHGIYRIINKSFNEHEHILTVEKGIAMLKDDERYKYPSSKVAFLFRLMKVYELAFFINTDHIFIPGILSLDMPYGLPAFDDANDRLTMSFVVEKVLPPNIVTRVIVQRNEFGEISNFGLLWRRGAALEYQNGNATALVVEDTRSVTVRVKGTNKTAYIASLRETIKAIFDSYQVIKPDLKYEVLIPEEAKASSPMRIPEERQEPLMLPENLIRDFVMWKQDYPHGNTIIQLGGTVQMYDIKITGDVDKFQTGEKNVIDDHSMNFNDSHITNSPVTGIMNDSTQTVIVNKPEIEGWLQAVTEELKKNNVRNDELNDAIIKLQAIIHTPNPSGNTIKHIVEAIKSIGYNIVSSTIWQFLMTHPPV